MREAAGPKKDLSRRPDFSAWLLAWDRYAIGTTCHYHCEPPCRDSVVTGAAVIGQMSFITAMKHKAIVTEVACSAMSKGKWSIMGVLFDEVSRFGVASELNIDSHCSHILVRKYWEEESGKKGDKFDVEGMVGTHWGTEHEMLLKRAHVLYDMLFANGKGVSAVPLLLTVLP